MVRHDSLRVLGLSTLLLVSAPIASILTSTTSATTTTLAAAPATPPQTGQTATAIYYNAQNVITVDDAKPSAQAVALDGTTILAVGTNDEILKLKGSGTALTDLKNIYTIVPGFIDAHSHLSGYGFFNDPANWLDVSSVNMFFKPAGTDPGCKTPGNPQYCFIPVTSQSDVVSRLKAAVADARKKNPIPPVLAFNYDAGRLGPDGGCLKAGMACTNLENGHAREQLDAIATDVEIYVAAESGHLAYVNSKALTALNICDVNIKKDGCYTPVINPTEEMKLAALGQLQEDLTFFGVDHYQGQLMKKDPGLLTRSLMRAAKMYAKRGFTVTQEGVASTFLVDGYRLVSQDPNFPVTAAMVMYAATASSFDSTLSMATKARTDVGTNPKLFVAAVKSFADGSLPGYTAQLNGTYYELFNPFTDSNIYQQPYRGLSDVDREALAQRVIDAHNLGFGIIIHQNGDAAIEDSIYALQKARQSATPSMPNLRDVVLHIPLITAEQLQKVKDLDNVTASFLMEDLFYWGQPMCQQVLGPERAKAAYPAATAIKTGLHVTMHSDTPVTTPEPMLGMWVATTRKVQMMSWYPRADQTCPQVLGASEAITVPQAINAYTLDAAWQYGLEKTMGSITPGKLANLTILNMDPLSAKVSANPDLLRQIVVHGTVLQGKYFSTEGTGVPAPARSNQD
jgi:predicted amidohydrolase YtcJ